MVNQLESTVSFLPVHGFVCKMAFFYFYIFRFQEISVILVLHKNDELFNAIYLNIRTLPDILAFFLMKRPNSLLYVSI
jgi:hypothetical protein